MVRQCVGLSVAVLLLGSAWVSAQEARPAGQAGQDGAVGTKVQFQTGKIVRVDPEKNVIVIRGADNKEQEYQLNDNTKYFGQDNKEMREGIRANNWRPGSDIRYQTGTGTTLRELRMGAAPGTPAPGTTPRREDR